ncbi:ABC transporter ATP-binding protein [Corynebacterium sp. 335C]
MRGFIRSYEAMLGRRSGLRGLIAVFSASAVLQGLTILLLVPVLRGLLDGGGFPVGWFAAMAACGVASLLLFGYGSQRAYLVCMNDLFDATSRVGRTVVRLPLGWFHAGSSAQVNRAALADCDDLSHIAPIVLPNVVTAIAGPATVVVGMLLLEWRMAVPLIVVLPVLWLIGRWGDRVSAEVAHGEKESDQQVSASVLEFASLQPVLRAAGGDRGLGRVEGAVRENHRATRTALDRNGAPMGAFILATQISAIVALAVGGHLALGGRMGVPLYLAMAAFCIRFTEPVAMLRAFMNEFGAGRDSIDRISAVVRAEQLPEPAEGEEKAPEDHGIVLRDVVFGYGDGPAVLDGVSAEFPSGTVTALVGPSGCGKSTILRIIGRFHDVRSGAVEVGGHDVREIGTGRLMDDTAMVFQDVYLFEGTIADNVRLGRPDATDAELAEAARRARLDEVVERLPHGWDSQVGERGGRLSGGERQRVAIARAFLKDAPILLLDEITSSLDGANEAAVTAAIRDLAAGRTTILIAHRLSTVTGADNIIVMDADGSIADQGTHGELAGRSGIYSRFLEDQAAGRDWTLTER